MSGLLPNADIRGAPVHVRFVPIADIDELIRTNRKSALATVSPRPNRLFDRPGVSPNVKSQSANKQCHHVDCWHKTIPVSESAPKYPTRNGDDGRPAVFPNPVHAFSPTLGIGQLLYTDNQSAMREMSALTPKADIAPTRSPAPLLLLRLEREKPE